MPKDQPTIIKFFKEFILKAYGEKSADGTYFEKSEEISRKFACTQFYNLLFMELATDDSKAAEFVNHVIPKVVDIKNAFGKSGGCSCGCHHELKR